MIFESSNNKKAAAAQQAQLESQMRLAEHKAQLDSQSEAARRIQATQDIAAELRRQNPALSSTEAWIQAESFLMRYGKKFEDSGMRGAELDAQGKELNNNKEKASLNEFLDTQPRRIEATNRENEDKIEEFDSKKIIRPFERASKIHGFSVKGTTPETPYTEVIEPTQEAPYFRSQFADNPNFVTKDPVTGETTLRKRPQGYFRIGEDVNVAPRVGGWETTTPQPLAPSAPAIDKAKLAREAYARIYGNTVKEFSPVQPRVQEIPTGAAAGAAPLPPQATQPQRPALSIDVLRKFLSPEESWLPY